MNFDRLFIITGGPGSGKGALVDALSQEGIYTMPEAGRVIIQDQVAIGGKVDEGVQAAWEAEIGKRIADLDLGKAKTTSWSEVRRRNLAKLPHAH